MSARHRMRYRIDRAFRQAAAIEIRSKQEMQCRYCKSVLLAGEYTIDHVVPKSRGGLDRKENLCVACVTCNLAKSDMSKKEFRRILESNTPPAGVLLIRAWINYRMERRLQRSLKRICKAVGVDL